MKRIIHILTVLVVALAACEREPYADFTVSSHQIGVFETVYFTNTSSDNADHFEWDFGDGTWSDAPNAAHEYEQSGTYLVTLKAFHGARIADQATVSIEVLTTALDVIVEEYYDHYRVPDASVILYPTQADWEYQTNALVEGFTDANGIVRFENLNPLVYYVDVWHANHNNYLLAGEDIGWIMTDPLVLYGINEFVAYVDYVGTVNRADGKKMAQYKLLKMESRRKKEVK